MTLFQKSNYKGLHFDGIYWGHSDSMNEFLRFYADGLVTKARLEPMAAINNLAQHYGQSMMLQTIQGALNELDRKSGYCNATGKYSFNGQSIYFIVTSQLSGDTEKHTGQLIQDTLFLECTLNNAPYEKRLFRFQRGFDANNIASYLM